MLEGVSHRGPSSETSSHKECVLEERAGRPNARARPGASAAERRDATPAAEEGRGAGRSLPWRLPRKRRDPPRDSRVVLRADSSQPASSFGRLRGIRVVSLACGGVSSLTWCGQSVLVLGGVVGDRLQHHPHGEGEHGGEEAIEDKVEEEDKG